jgi:hypothetical protein
MNVITIFIIIKIKQNVQTPSLNRNINIILYLL